MKSDWQVASDFYNSESAVYILVSVRNGYKNIVAVYGEYCEAIICRDKCRYNDPMAEFYVETQSVLI